MKKQYVCGFLFSSDGKNVVLIRKNKPQWQKGLLNGVGGKVESDELPSGAMIREFKEETGITHDNWTCIAVLHNQDSEIHFYYGFSSLYANVKSITDEKVGVYEIESLNTDSDTMTIKNLTWLIPMCFDDSVVFTDSEFK